MIKDFRRDLTCQRIYFTDRKPFFFIELFLFLDISELPKYPDDWMIPVNDWLTLSLIQFKQNKKKKAKLD